MELLILNESFQVVFVMDFFKSLIWADRYFKNGDFELYTTMELEILLYLTPNNYAVLNDSDHVMIIETIEPITDVDEGPTFKVSGRSLEVILERRIVWSQTTLTGNLQNGIQLLLNDAIISPMIPERKISNFIFEPSTDIRITSLTLDAKYFGENLYDVIQKICEERNIGFKITLTDDNKFKFRLYCGEDRTYSQSVNSHVIFSPSYENLINSSYIQSISKYRNVTLVVGEGEDTAQKTYVIGSDSGISRREIFTDARDISSDNNGVTLTTEEYNLLLEQRGNETLAENTYIESFEGKVDASNMFIYGRDFSIGDIIQIENEYGIEGTARITEFIMSQNAEGVEFYPTFTNNQQRGDA